MGYRYGIDGDMLVIQLGLRCGSVVAQPCALISPCSGVVYAVFVNDVLALYDELHRCASLRAEQLGLGEP